MSHVVYRCSQLCCVRGGSHVGECEECAHLDFTERVADVYRPHRRAVKQAVRHRAKNNVHGRVFIAAYAYMLGCPDAVPYVRRRVRIRNGAYLIRAHLGGRRAMNWRQALVGSCFALAQTMARL